MTLFYLLKVTFDVFVFDYDHFMDLVFVFNRKIQMNADTWSYSVRAAVVSNCAKKRYAIPFSKNSITDKVFWFVADSIKVFG